MSSKSDLPEVKPDIEFIFQLVQKVAQGKIRVPRFQRAFIWRQDQMTDLLDSIRKQYPIGSLLMWETDDELSSAEWVGPIRIPANTKKISASFLLDGQQRLSTLVGSLMPGNEGESGNQNEDDPNRWRIRYDLKTEKFAHFLEKDKLEPWHFPLQKLMGTVDFLKECGRILTADDGNGEQYVEGAQKLVQAFTAYQVPIIRIKNTNLAHAVEVFARLNSKGQKMSPDQMVSALTYLEQSDDKVGFRLSDQIDDLLETLSGYDFEEVGRVSVLRALLATLGQNVYETDWTRLSSGTREGIQRNLPAAVEPTRESLIETCKFLQRIGVYNGRLLPYAMQMVVLSAFFTKCKTPTKEQLAFLEKWFWVTSFTAKFGSTNTSRDNGLVQEFREIVSQNISPSMLDNMRLDDPALPIPKSFDMRSARTRTLLNVMLRQAPRDSEGKIINEPWKQIQSHGPVAMGKITNTADKEIKSGPANRIFKIDMKNSGQAKAWIKQLKPDIQQQVLESHCIPSEAFNDLANDKDDSFLEKRLEYLIQLEIKFMQTAGVTVPKDTQPRIAPIDTDE
ncbi:MAG: DUF262 domain-containing protein [Deltaproteobacteria bacterium]|nr:DUF262 domain-containing protein [Deltaproteobacteria bacterium]